MALRMRRRKNPPSKTAFKRIAMAIAVLSASGCFATKGDVEVSITPSESLPKPPVRSGWAYLQDGEFQSAAAAFHLKLSQDKDDENARFGLAEALRRAGRAEAAEAHYAKLLESAEYRTRALTGVGYAKLASFDQVGALLMFSEATSADPTNWKAWLGLAQLTDFAHNWAEADVHYAKALEHAEDRALVLNNLGVSMFARGDSVKAVSYFEAALSMDGDSERAQNNFDVAMSTLHRHARETSDTHLDARSRAKKLNNVAYVAMLRGDIPRAQSLFDKAIDAHPSFYPVAEKNKQVLKAIKDAHN